MSHGRNDSILSCHRAKDGKALDAGRRYREVGTVYASLVGAKDRFYMVGQKGPTIVFRLGEEAEILARNELDDWFSATPALVEGQMILRGESHLY